MRNVGVQVGGGLVVRKRFIAVDEPYGEFLDANLPCLFAKELDGCVLEHVIAHEAHQPIDGFIAEFGVFSGTSINMLASVYSSRTIYGFDSFEGLPHSVGLFRAGEFSMNHQLPEVRPNVRLIEGWFNETLPPFLKARPNEKAALLHIDCDLYSSTKTVLELLRDRIVPGTIIVFDEICNLALFYQEEMKAFFEFVEGARIRFEWIGYGFDVGCLERLPGLRERFIWFLFKAGCDLFRRQPRLKVAAAVRILGA
jgi:predicted O-methyltransferase YrrM